MNRVFNKYFPKDLSTTGYKSNKEYLDENIKRIKMLIDYYADCTINSNENLLKHFNKEALEDFFLSDYYISSRLQNTPKDVFIPADYVKRRFSMNDLEWTCLMMSIIFESDTKYRNILLKISDSENKLTYELVTKIYYFIQNLYDIEDAYDNMATLKFKMSSICFNDDLLKLDENIHYFIIYGDSKLSLNGIEVYVPNPYNTNVLPIREELAKQIRDIAKLKPQDKQFCFYLHGEDGIGKKTLVKRASELMSECTVIIDLKLYAFLNKEIFYKLIRSPLREALIINASICLDHFEAFDDMTPQKYEYLQFLLTNIPMFSKEIFILSNKKNINIPHINNSLFLIDIPILPLSYKENYIIWENKINEIKYTTAIHPMEMANKFNFNPSQINLTAERAQSLWYLKGCKPLSIKDLCECAYSQSLGKISDKATLIKATHTWDELILDKKEKNMIRSACDQVKYKHIVYDKWGMNKRVLYGRGLSMLFSGPPGTGKTMAAQVVANELGLEIYKADISKIISKYIGETEKNLNSLFSEAKKSNVILFFDETDALLGKRTEVKDSHDKNANVETSYLLQKMEEYDGITIMTTNYPENIDKAFFRRISYVIHFAFPNANIRKKIWMNVFTKKMPLSNDIDFDYLAERFEISGGNIKNIAVNSAFMAARDSQKIKMEYILKATVYELKKQGKTIIEDDLGEYAYLIKF